MKKPFQRHLAWSLAAATLLLAGCQNLSRPVIRFDRQVNYGDAKGCGVGDQRVRFVRPADDCREDDRQPAGDRHLPGPSHGDHFHGEEQDQRVHRHDQVMNSIQTALVKSGKVRFVRSIKEMAVWCGRTAAPEPERPVQAEQHSQTGQHDGGQIQHGR